jgi:amino acid adenylation domain-containing protein
MVYLLHQAIDNGAERHPDKEAVRFSGQSLSYKELAARTNSLARVLIEQGVTRGDRVGIYLNKSLESVVAVYGIMKAGAAYVPLDPFAPVARLSFVIRDCHIRCLVTKDAKMESVREMVKLDTGLECLIGVEPQEDLNINTISWDEVYNTPGDDLPDVGTIEQDLAYILYTSGSTGDPKGIMHTHRSGLSFAEWAAQTYALRPDDRLSNHAPLHFDLSTFDIFAGGLAGATVVVIPEALTKFPASLSKLIQDEKITVWYSVPFALIQMMLRGGLESRDLSNLRWLLFAGEVFPTKHLRQLMALLPGVKFSNLYGPTETNVCTYYHVPPLADDSDEPIPIGRVCENAEAVVVDADEQPVAQGQVGELLIRGGIVMRGYWGQPEKTNKGFFRRQVFSFCEDIFYRTGDLVQLQPDGNFKYLGRKDHQIKTRGYRVELGEIEAALLANACIEEAAVYPVPDGEGSNLIEAAIIVKPGAEYVPEQVQEKLAGRLPSYAMPAKIWVVDNFPRTSTGKINRRELQVRAESSSN